MLARQEKRRYRLLDQIRRHAYDGNVSLATRVYVENRISRREFDEHVYLGRLQRAEHDKEKQTNP